MATRCTAFTSASVDASGSASADSNTAVAAVVEHRERFAGRRITTILCGSNVAAADFAQWVLEPAARAVH